MQSKRGTHLTVKSIALQNTTEKTISIQTFQKLIRQHRTKFRSVAKAILTSLSVKKQEESVLQEFISKKIQASLSTLMNLAAHLLTITAVAFRLSKSFPNQTSVQLKKQRFILKHSAPHLCTLVAVMQKCRKVLSVQTLTFL